MSSCRLPQVRRSLYLQRFQIHHMTAVSQARAGHPDSLTPLLDHFIITPIPIPSHPLLQAQQRHLYRAMPRHPSDRATNSLERHVTHISGGHRVLRNDIRKERMKRSTARKVSVCGLPRKKMKKVRGRILRSEGSGSCQALDYGDPSVS